MINQTNTQARNRYRPRASYAGATLCLFTAEREMTADDPRLGWRDFLPQDTPERMVPGATTGETLNPDNVRVLSRLITDEINVLHQAPVSRSASA